MKMHFIKAEYTLFPAVHPDRIFFDNTGSAAASAGSEWFVQVCFFPLAALNIDSLLDSSCRELYF